MADDATNSPNMDEHEQRVAARSPSMKQQRRGVCDLHPHSLLVERIATGLSRGAVHSHGARLIGSTPLRVTHHETAVAVDIFRLEQPDRRRRRGTTSRHDVAQRDLERQSDDDAPTG